MTHTITCRDEGCGHTVTGEDELDAQQTAFLFGWVELFVYRGWRCPECADKLDRKCVEQGEVKREEG